MKPTNTFTTCLITIPMVVLALSSNAFAQCEKVKVTVDTSRSCAPGIFEFKAVNLPPNTKISWDFGKGFVPGEVTYKHIQADAGSTDLTVQLTFADNSTCRKKFPNIVTVFELPKPQLELSQYEFCNVNDAFYAKDLTPFSKTRIWGIGGQIYEAKTPVMEVNFSESGPQNISLVVVDSAGCKASKIFQSIAFVHATPEIVLETDTMVVCTKTPVNYKFLTNLTDSEIKKHNWKFHGTADSSELRIPKPIFYTKGGFYNTSLEITTTSNCTYTTHLSEKLKVVEPSLIDVRFSKDLICVPDKVRIELRNVSKTGRIDWKLGTTQYDTIDYKTRDYYFHTDKINRPKLTIGYHDGICYSELIKDSFIQVQSLNVEIAGRQHFDCEAPLQVVLKDSTASSQSGNIFFNWLLTDLNGKVVQNGEGKSFTHHLSKPAYYNLRLIAQHENGCKDTAFKAAYVRIDSVRPNFKAKPQNACLNQQVRLINLTPDASYRAGNQQKWWIYRHGESMAIDSGESVDHLVYATYDGSYDVRLMVWNSVGCQNEVFIKDAFRVIKPKSAFALTISTICAKDSIQLISKASPIAEYEHKWKIYNAADTQTFEGEFSKIMVKKPGIYNVDYTISILGECSRSSTQNNVLNVHGIESNIVLAEKHVCRNQPINPVAQINNVVFNGIGKSVRYKWLVTPSDDVELNYSTTASPRIKFTRNGEYHVILIVENDAGCVDTSISGPITVGLRPDFVFEADHGCVGEEMSFVNNSSTFINQWTHYISPTADYVVSNLSQSNGFIRFNKSGIYEVNLIAGYSGFCTDTFRQILTVEKTVAQFSSMDTLMHCAPAMARFQSTSINANLLIWSFGDGSTLTTRQENSTHLYEENTAKVKPYTVKLVAVSKNGCRDSLIKRELITIYGPALQLNASITKGCDPLLVQFSGKSEGIDKMFFDYGDGGDFGYNINQPHLYVNKQSTEIIFHPVALIVDKHGCASAIKGQPILVKPTPDGEMNIAKTEGCVPFTIKLNSRSTNAAMYKWDVDGDNITDTNGTSAGYTYKTSGNFKLTLQVVNSFGCEASSFRQIRAVASPLISIGMDPIPCPGGKIKVWDNSMMDAPLQARHWQVKWGDSLLHSYDSILQFAAPYSSEISLILKVKDIFGCSSEKEMKIDLRRVQSDEMAKISRLSVIEESVEITSIKPTSNYSYSILYRADSVWNEIERAPVSRTIFVDKDAFPSQAPACYAMRHFDECGFASDSSGKHCSVHLEVTQEDLELVSLKWSTYVGWKNVEFYNVYSISDGKSNLISKKDGKTTTFVDTRACSGRYCYQIQALGYGADEQSFSNIQCIDVVRPANTSISHIHNATVLEDESVYVQIRSSNTINHFKISRESDGEKVQFYCKTSDFKDLDVNTNKQSYTYSAHGIDRCSEIGTSGAIGKTIHLHIDEKDEATLTLGWNAYEGWPTSIKEYHIFKKSTAGFDSIARVDGHINQFEFPLSLDINDGNCFRVVAINSKDKLLKSSSNTACLEVPPKVYLPTAFRPKSEVGNNVFKPTLYFIQSPTFFKEGKYEFKVYDRFGGLRFCTTNPEEAWTGMMGKKLAEEGVYLYTVKLVGADNLERNYSGTVTLLR